MQPLSNDMIKTALDGRGFSYFVDADGDIAGNFQGNLIYFFRLGARKEILQVRAMMQHVFSVEDVQRLYEFCNTWNRDQLWPKAYVQVTDDGQAIVVGEVTTDCEHGLTTEQLDQVLLCGVATGCRLGEALGELKSGSSQKS
ncbi:YbjN domain-containing protein [Actinoplanes sp. NEAU-A12]|uniref:YbjN domain-containing protein n=1 Tax=Actinoplanes sandaracinus TaxID=3045177 RepID=A0ABT6WCX2_9ACTN|nr:YbjN domain-containing protein [Actinoplanes sandaracinus]MDI6097553.1 YbjN domain-containing protein [Actinoplanes sandaracinus]